MLKIKRLTDQGLSITLKLAQRLKNVRNQEVLVLDYSHAEVFLDKVASVSGTWFNLVFVRAATVSGLKNPNSVTKAQPIFWGAIKAFCGQICITLWGK
jgi:hypothetical protein